MTNKYKISELAKDFNIKSKDLITILTDITGTEKKSGGVLGEEEISLVFTYLTKKNSVKNFEEYFAMGAENREKAKKA
ncbi:MAG: translation initiation factor IF-2 N-terminal domain-containing protein, partial [Acutalibacteraceae bacterium]|nr:translation initiation factor IF-2 N-terminal domain-containing protein [Acutalibacteraceae bacterium]